MTRGQFIKNTMSAIMDQTQTQSPSSPPPDDEFFSPAVSEYDEGGLGMIREGNVSRKSLERPRTGRRPGTAGAGGESPANEVSRFQTGGGSPNQSRVSVVGTDSPGRIGGGGGGGGLGMNQRSESVLTVASTASSNKSFEANLGIVLKVS